MDKMLRRLIGEDVQLATELSPDLGRVKADRGQIEQVIMNLVVNARDAMPAGGCITIQTAEVDLAGAFDGLHTPVEPGRYVMLVVSDNGQGMDAETRARIFEPFFTTKELGKGTGLGLSTVYGILRQSGGYILVESEPMQGATFRIYLPRVAWEASSTVEPRPGVPITLAGSETVLLVEDELMVRRLTFDILTQTGYKVLEARDPADARLICEQFKGPIHLMLSDVVMPMMSGVELADCLRPLRPEMKILFMSGYTGENLASSAFIHKPFTPAGLAGKVREVLDAVSGL
jgi:CheY-like chemotaxis protein